MVPVKLARRRLLVLIVIIAILISIVTYCRLNITQTSTSIPQEIKKISKNIHIIVTEPSGESRTLLLDPNQWYCKITIFHGGSNPYNYDLAYPNAPIVFFFLEDIPDQEKADNWSDLIIRMNPVIVNGTKIMCVVFFAEGAYSKQVYYQNRLMHNYTNNNELSNYGIAYLPLEDT
jgi:hypothetical protein